MSMLSSIPAGNAGVIASSDDNYAPHLAVVFASLLSNCPEPAKVSLFCIDGGISVANRRKLEHEVMRFGGAPLEFIEFDSDRFDSLPTCKHITSAAYYRVAIPELFDSAVEKIIYLDCDVVVRGDIFELWNTDIKDFHIAAVENLSGHTYKKLGVPQHEYFNSGVMLINLTRWRQDDIAQKVFEFKQQHPDRICTNDQCALNGVMHKTWKPLPLKWNHQTGLYRPSAQTSRFPEAEVREAIINPAIIHYIGWDKPWRNISFHPLASEYDRYASQLDGSSKVRPVWIDYVKAYGSVSRLKKLFRQLKWLAWYRKNGFDLYDASSRP